MYVSAIIAARNAEDTLSEALVSLRDQTHPEWEAIIVDDGSTDGTAAVAEGFVRDDPRFRLVRLEANVGVSQARNIGIRHARHDWLLFLDADDWILPQHLERMTRALTKDPDLDAIYCGWAFLTPDGYYVFKDLGGPWGDLFALHAQECPYAIHAYVVRKALVEACGLFDPGLRVCEDWDLWQRFARAGARFGHVRAMLAPYRMRAASASMDGHRILSDGLRVLHQGHAPDDRVPELHPVHPDGLMPGGLKARRFYLLCSAAGLMIGRGEDARGLLAALEDAPSARLDPRAAADCVAQAAMLSACRPLRAWAEAWKELAPQARPFFEALEERLGTPMLASRIDAAVPLLIRTYMAPLSPLHRAAAARARLRLNSLEARSALHRRRRLWKWRLRQLAVTALRLSPALDRRVRAHRRSRRPAYGRVYFEHLFGTQVDPWDYTSPYEQLKYDQTLDLIPERPIEHALELACAEGHFTVQLAPHVNHLLATDLSEVAAGRTAERCRRHGYDHVQVRALDFMNEAIPGRYDLIVCSEVLYFAGSRKRLERIARKIARALKPGGHLVMAHGNVSADDPERPGFAWEHAFGAKGIEETFSGIDALDLAESLRTPLYRVQLFRRRPSAVTHSAAPPRIIKARHAEPLPPEVDYQVLWDGCSPHLPILMYHRVAPTGSEALAPWRVTPEAFEDQLRFLKEAGFRSVQLEDWRDWVDHGTPLPRNAIILTFDDGYLDFKTHAWPLLQRYGFSATVYLVAGKVGGTNEWDASFGEELPLMTWRDIRALQREGVSFGSHTVTHRMLTALPVRALWHELTRSMDVLERELGERVYSLAYPFGASNRLIQALTGLSGYTFGLSCDDGFCTTGHSLLALPRIEVTGSDDLAAFARKLGHFGVPRTLPTSAPAKPLESS